MYLKNTYKKLSQVGFMIVKGLREELVAQKHNATHKLSNSLKPRVKGKSGVMDIVTSKLYWRAVNNPKAAEKPNLLEIKKWVAAKNLPQSAVGGIFNKLKNMFYGKPYVYWTEGNNLKRTDFAGITARKYKNKVATELAPAIGKDVVAMIRKEIKQNYKRAKTI